MLRNKRRNTRMASSNLHQPPASLKQVSHYLKVAVEHDNRDPVIAYWARFAAVHKSLSIDKSSPEAKIFVVGLLEWLEHRKKELSGNEAVTIEAAGEAHIENYALRLFSWADTSDRSAVFNKNVVKAFYTAGILFDILESLRPPLSDEFTSARKYAKWKAAYIHNCLKNGETPVPGGSEDGDEEQNSYDPSSAAHFGFVDPSTHNPGAPASSTPYTGGSATTTTTTNHHDDDRFVSYVGEPGGASANSPYQVPVADPAASSYGDQVGTPASLSVEQIAKAQKYCKWAGSALNFDDTASAIENLEKALHLLKTGQELG